MPSKIEKYGLGEKITQLAQSGVPLRDIARNISTEDTQISHMTVKRFLESDDVKKIQRELEVGSDVEAQLRAEIRGKIDDWEDETHEIYIIMKKALKRIIKEGGDDLKVIKAAKDTLNAVDQSRRNLMLKVGEGFKRFGHVEKAREVNYIQVNNMIVAMSKELCPNCRKKIIDLIIEEDVQDVNSTEDIKEVEYGV